MQHMYVGTADTVRQIMFFYLLVLDGVNMKIRCMFKVQTDFLWHIYNVQESVRHPPYTSNQESRYEVQICSVFIVNGDVF